MLSDPILAAAFLAPAFVVAGALLAGVPILIHLLNRRRYRTIEWAAMTFLLRAMKRNRRRLRFESWLLLATRCLVLGLLGLALARPLSCSSTALGQLGQRQGLHVIVIDNGCAMAYQDGAGKTHLDRAKQLAEQLIDRFTAGNDSVALISAGAPAAAVIAKPTFDLQQARSAIDHLPQRYGTTDLSTAVQLATALATESAGPTDKNCYLLTDSARSTWLYPAAAQLKTEGPALAKNNHVTLFNFSPGVQSNAAVLDLHPVGNLLTVNGLFGNDFSALVRGFGGDLRSQVQWRLDDAVLGEPAPFSPTPDSPPLLRPGIAFRSVGPHVVAVSLGGGGGSGSGGGGGGGSGGDRLPADDDRRCVVDVLARAKVLIVEGQRGAGELGGSGAFLQLALSPPSTGGPAGTPVGAIAAETISDLELGNRPLSDEQAVILCGVGQIRAGVADQLQQFVEAGGTLMLFMGEPVTSENYNDVLLPRHLLPGPLTRRVSAAAGQNFAFAFDPNGSLHPLLRAFAHQEKTGLRTAQIFTYWQADVPTDPQVRVLDYRPIEAGFPVSTASSAAPAGKPDPAITVSPLGQGRVIFVSTTANADWTTLPAKPAYVALMNELLANSINRGDAWMNLTVGSPLNVPPTVRLTTVPTLLDPASRPVELHGFDTGQGLVYHSPPLQRPGQYTLHTGDAALPIVVNVPAVDEADVRTLEPASLKAALGGIELTLAGDTLPPPATASAAGGELGWDVMVVVGLLVAAECVLALFFGHAGRTTA